MTVNKKDGSKRIYADQEIESNHKEKIIYPLPVLDNILTLLGSSSNV